MKRYRFELANPTALLGEKQYDFSDPHLRITVQVEVPDEVSASVAWALTTREIIGGRTFGDILRFVILPSEEGDRW